MLKLNAEQIFFLKVFTGYKAFARKENFERDQRYNKDVVISKSYDQLAAELLALGLLKADKNGRLSLKMTWEKTRQLMSLQNDTVESLMEQIAEREKHVSEYNAIIERLRPLNPPWPSTDHYALKDAGEQRVYTLGLLADLKERLKIIRQQVGA